MKGLLFKDWYVLKKDCRVMLLLFVVFLAASLMEQVGFLFSFYSCLIASLLPVTLLASDEKSGWERYSCTMPYTRAQLVSAKYLIGLLALCAMLLLGGLLQAVRQLMGGSFVAVNYAVMLLQLFAVSLLSASFCLPFIFRYGAEKGRIAYYCIIGVVCAVSTITSNRLNGVVAAGEQTLWPFLLLAVASVGVFALSWRLSITFYKRRTF